MQLYVFLGEFVFSGIVDGFIYFSLYLIFLGKADFLKEHKLKTALVTLVYGCFSYWITMNINFSFKMYVYIVLMVLLFASVAKQNIYSSIISVFLSIFLPGVIELCFAFATSYIFHIPIIVLSDPYHSPEFRFYIILIIKALMFALIYILSRYKINLFLQKYNFFSKETHSAGYMVAILLFILMFFSITQLDKNPLVSASFGIILLSMMVLIALDYKERLKEIRFRSQFDVQAEYIKNMQEVVDSVRKEKHDYANHLTTLIAMSYINSPDSLPRIQEYAKKLISSSETSYTFFDTGNKYLDGLLAIKSKVAKENNIKFNVTIDEPIDSVNISDIALTSIVGNIVDNAFDALSNDVDKNNKFVSIHAFFENQKLCLSISNNGPKILEKNMKKIFQSKFSTKSISKGERGYGLFIVSELVSKFNSKISVHSSDTLTEFVIEFKLDESALESIA